jgi:hypothetical protein
MSIDNIKFPAIILQALYTKPLYNMKTSESAGDLTKTNNISYLGNNQKKVAILIKSAEVIYLPDDELNFLLGILTACKLSMADIALINISKNTSLTYKEITEQLKAEKILLFGINPTELGLPMQFPNYQIQNYNSQVYLSSVSLDNQQTDKKEKMKLWNCLKKIFP